MLATFLCNVHYMGIAQVFDSFFLNFHLLSLYNSSVLAYNNGAFPLLAYQIKSFTPAAKQTTVHA